MIRANYYLILAGTLCIVVLLLGVPTTVGADTETFNVSAVVDETEVWDDETVEATVTIKNNGERDRLLTEVTIRDQGGEVRAATDVEASRLQPGEKRTITVENIAVETGVNSLVAVVEHKYGTVENTAEFEVVAVDPTPTLDIESTAGEIPADRSLSLSVGNPLNNEITRIQMTVDQQQKTDLRLQDQTESLPQIRPGKSRTVEFGIREAPSGSIELPVNISFVTADGDRWKRQRTLRTTLADPTSTVEPDVAPVQLDLSASQNIIATERTLTLTVGNPQDNTIRRVEATLEQPPKAPFQITDRTGIVPVIEPGKTSEISFTVPDAPAGNFEFPVTMSYETDAGASVDVSKTLNVSFAKPVTTVEPSVAPVQITDVSISGTGGVSGEVANTRNREVAGITVSIVDTDGVSPTGTGTYFVGSLDGGTFNSFNTIQAEISSNRDTIPIALTYSIKGTQYRTVTKFQISGSTASTGTVNGGQENSVPAFDAGEDTGGDNDSLVSGQLVPLLVGSLVALLGIGIAGVVLRRR
jgi:hypothetical protein